MRIFVIIVLVTIKAHENPIPVSPVHGRLTSRECSAGDSWFTNVKILGGKMCTKCVCHPVYRWVCANMNPECESHPKIFKKVEQVKEFGNRAKQSDSCEEHSKWVKPMKNKGKDVCLICTCYANIGWKCTTKKKKCQLPGLKGSILCEQKKLKDKKELLPCMECYCDDDNKLICDRVTTDPKTIDCIKKDTLSFLAFFPEKKYCVGNACNVNIQNINATPVAITTRRRR